MLIQLQQGIAEEVKKSLSVIITDDDNAVLAIKARMNDLSNNDHISRVALADDVYTCCHF